MYDLVCVVEAAANGGIPRKEFTSFSNDRQVVIKIESIRLSYECLRNSLGCG